MKIEVFGRVPEPEETIRLRLQQTPDGANIVSVDANGSVLTGGYIIQFVCCDGKLCFRRCHNSDSPIADATDSHHRIREVPLD